MLVSGRRPKVVPLPATTRWRSTCRTARPRPTCRDPSRRWWTRPRTAASCTARLCRGWPPATPATSWATPWTSTLLSRRYCHLRWDHHHHWHVPTQCYHYHFQISPVNNNISKTSYSSGGNTPPPPPAAPPTAVTISGQSQMGSSSFSQTPATPIGHSSSSFTPTTSFPRQQFPSSGMYGWY